MKGLTRLADLEVPVIIDLLDRAEVIREMEVRARRDLLRHKRVVTAFFERSTRTKVSFTMAATSAGCQVVDFAVDGSSVGKGESLRDTFLTLGAIGCDVFVVRHSEHGVPAAVEDWTGIPVISGGEGRISHPTQTLLDLLTMRDVFHRFEGLSVGVVGDIVNSRVASGLIEALPRLGAAVHLVGPQALVGDLWAGQVQITDDLDAVIGSLDVVYALRLQLERGSGELITDAGEFRRGFGMTKERMARMKPHARVMHAGPMNRGVEIDSEVADSARSLVLSQVANGVPVRMACLERATR